MSDDLVERAREALDGVTPGPWRHDGHTGVMASGSVDTYSGVVWATIIRAEQTSETDVERRSWETSGSPDANAHFIAASRELVPAMADRIEELEAKLAKAVEALTEAGKILKNCTWSTMYFHGQYIDREDRVESYSRTIAEINGVGDE